MREDWELINIKVKIKINIVIEKETPTRLIL